MADFKAFIHEYQAELEKSLCAIIPSDMLEQIDLTNGSGLDRVTEKDEITGENSQLSLSEAEVSNDYRIVNNLEKTAANRRTTILLSGLRCELRQLLKKMSFRFFSRKAVIPKYGFPVDVVELDTQRTQQDQEAFEVLLQRDLSIAISEFAPTSKLVANKKVWTSYGLKKVADKEWPRKCYKRCQKHNVFLQWDQGQNEPPTPCDDQLEVFKYIILFSDL